MAYFRPVAEPTRIILQTPRLILREMNPSNLDFIAELLADPNVMRYWPRPHTREESAGWIERQQQRYARDGCGYWLATEQTTGEPIGQVGVMMTPIDGNVEPALGWIIARRHWRKGFAFEGAAACVKYTFRTLRHHRAVALVRPQNLPSVQLARKLGLMPAGTTMHADLEHLILARAGPDA